MADDVDGIRIGDRLDNGRLIGVVNRIDESGVYVSFTEDKDYHMHTWNEFYEPDTARSLIKATKASQAAWKQQQNQKNQKNANKKQTKVLLRLPKHYVICRNCKIVLGFDPANIEKAWTGVPMVHCVECGFVIRTDVV